ncbi:MAG: peptidylprolyl isomerase, partial [Bacteroidetes bacterium]|nr:peptidylprolyl isomerase [Bacteroidota bacterium]
MKSIINLKYIYALCIALLFNTIANAQEIIPDEVKESAKPQDTVKNTTSTKIDGVAAVVGEFVILDSDLDKTIVQMQAQGIDTDDIPRCQLFGKLLEDKLYAHHAIQDSVEVSDAEIRSNVDYQLQQFLAQSGKSMEELLKFYNKKDEASFREEMYEINKSNKLASEMQR